MPSTLRFRSYLRAPPRTVLAEMKALGLERHRMADRFFDEKDLSRLCTELFGAAPHTLDWNARSGAGSVERFEIEFDEVPGPLETTWGVPLLGRGHARVGRRADRPWPRARDLRLPRSVRRGT